MILTMSLRNQIESTIELIDSSGTQLFRQYPTSDMLNGFSNDLEIQVVLTQHPTEVRRRTFIQKEKTIATLNHSRLL